MLQPKRLKYRKQQKVEIVVMPIEVIPLHLVHLV